jgi:hypothetical protein
MTGQLEPVAIVYDQAQLAVLMSLLEHGDIHPLPLSHHLIAFQWDMTLAYGGIRICVPDFQAGEARALLAGLEPWQPSRKLFTGNFAVDLLLSLLILLVCLLPPPARLPATFLIDRSVSVRRVQQAG